MNNINFSRNLLALRKERKITQEELANYLGITKAAVSKWERYLYKYIGHNIKIPFISTIS